jgi:flagellar basal body-associated protein FliL
VSQTTTVSAPSGSSGRVLAIILGILGVLAIILGVLYVAGALNSVHFLVGKTHKGSHEIRAAVSFVVGIVLLILAWAAGRTRRS